MLSGQNIGQLIALYVSRTARPGAGCRKLPSCQQTLCYYGAALWRLTHTTQLQEPALRGGLSLLMALTQSSLLQGNAGQAAES